MGLFGKSPTKDNGLYFLHPQHGNASQATLDIVAVHGLNGHYMETWTIKHTMWLRDLLHEKFPDARIMTFAYDASPLMGASPHGIAENAETLVQKLEDAREDNDKERPIVFIGHSLGGLVIKKALHVSHARKQDSSIAKNTKGIVFFGTPHRGSADAELADLVTRIASSVTPLLRSPFVKALKPNSEDLMKISEDFRPLAKNYAIATFYEEHVLRPFKHVIVDREAAVMGLPHEETMMMAGDHRSMCRFVPGDVRFDSVWRAIRRAAKGRVDYAQDKASEVQLSTYRRT